MQGEIADYLDRETAQIDTLIAKQEQLIERLHERASAMVSSRIFEALAPTVQLRHVATKPIESGLDATGEPDAPPNWPRYVRTTDIVDTFRLHADRGVAVEPRVARKYLLEEGDLLLTRAGSVGKTYLHAGGSPACFAGYLVRFRADQTRLENRYAAYWTQSRHFHDQIQTGAIRSTIDNYSASKYQATCIPLPPLDEQRRIVAYLDEQTAKTDALIAKAERFIELAKERRAALITAAVTGQLDVTAA